jgi:ComF family protein
MTPGWLSAAALRTPVRRLGAALAAAMPLRCACCGQHEGDPFCAGCCADAFDPTRHRCRICALPLPARAGAVCGACLRQPPPFDATVAAADYAAPVSGMVLALKNGARLSLARAFGRLLATRLPLDPPAACGTVGAPAPGRSTAPWLVPVPLAPERQRERGFNQSLEIARALAHATGLALRPNALARVRHAAPQHLLDLAARRRNLHGAFVVAAALRDRPVIVVDDVMTTGSTLAEVAAVLKRAGAARVTNLVVARTA